ncbi:Protein F48E3.2 [Aphelenchoides avenae]|nr:Protein F48E3.2 [Aphelenchus avenae]
MLGSTDNAAQHVLVVQEVSPTDIRGTMSFFAEVAFVITNTVGGVLGMSSVLGDRLPHLVGFAVLPTIVAIVVLIPLHETPKFLLIKKCDEVGAVHAIKFYQNTDASATEDVLKAVGDERDDTAGSWRDLLLVPHLRAGLLLGIVALQLTTSIWTMVYYSTEFLRRANVDYDLAEYVSSGVLILSTVATLSGTAVIERFSRRGLFISASLVNLTAIFLFTICSQLQPLVDLFKYGCIACICLHGISYSFATGPIAWFITAELVSTRYRSAWFITAELVSTRYRSACQSVALSLNHIVAMLLIGELKGADGDDGPQEHVAMKTSAETGG